VPVRSPTPSVAELRAATQPSSLFERNSGEHWAGRLYMRSVSPYATKLLLRTRLSPNAVTWLMILCGLAAAGVLTLPGVLPAVVAVLLIQLQLLFDCSDGEMARWLDRKSPVGVYLDRLGHYLTETALPIALGIRADGGWDSIGGWTTLGLVVAVLQLLVKAETALVHVARMESGMTLVEDSRAVAAPRGGQLRTLRSALGHLPFYRAFVAVEFTLLALAAELLDATRALVVGLVVVGVVTAVGHLAAILASKRLQ
jgi:phosphatidylglycerophosphate synthase